MRSGWTCAEHGTVAPLHAARSGTTEHVRGVAATSAVPVWLPWPLPTDWLVTGVRHAGDERTGAVATVLGCSGPNRFRRTVAGEGPAADLLIVAEQPAVGLGASLAGLPEVDAGDSLSGALLSGGPHAKVHAAGHPTALWHVPAGEDRAVFVGEARGVWLWLIIWPPSAGAMALDGLTLVDARELDHPLELPTGATNPQLT